MATANPTPEVTESSVPLRADLLVSVSAMPPEEFGGLVAKLAAVFPPEALLIATSNDVEVDSQLANRIVPAPASTDSWTLTASHFVSAYQAAQKNDARAILMLGPDAGSLDSMALRNLADAVLSSSSDLAIAHYDLPPRAAMINSAILYPLTRALFATRARFPLAIDLGLSMRMAERLASAAHRFSTVSQGNALLWPVEEASVAGFAIAEADIGNRVLPQPPDLDLNAILPLVVGSLFADIDLKAAFWQRPRPLPPGRNHIVHSQSADAPADITPMLEAFRLAYVNLREIWSLVLPPNSLLGLKRLAATEAAMFRMPENLWARIVYDFLLAYRLRTINRGHLLGALIPLYLACVASHINVTASGTNPELHQEAIAAAFEAEKPYLVARWRWPDRFNP